MRASRESGAEMSCARLKVFSCWFIRSAHLLAVREPQNCRHLSRDYTILRPTQRLGVAPKPK